MLYVYWLRIQKKNKHIRTMYIRSVVPAAVQKARLKKYITKQRTNANEKKNETNQTTGLGGQ